MNVCDAPQPQYLPDLVLDIIFSNLKLSDLYSCMLVCRNWNRAINRGRSELWKLLCRRELTEELLNSKDLSSLQSHKDKLRALYNSWNPEDCSKYISVSNHGFTFISRLNKDRFINGYHVIDNFHSSTFPMFFPGIVMMSTDMIRTKTGYTTGKHIWEITFNGPLGGVAMIGVSTKEAPLHCIGFKPLLGANKHSWGWNLVSNDLEHNAISHGNYPLLKNAPKYKLGEKLLLVLDCDNGTLHFEKCDVFLGIAFKNLPKTKLYPSVSVVHSDSNVSVLYISNTGSARQQSGQTQF
ncbi:F-box/SPRY domain-containing protein 1-like [Acyrthosiphon pisum]|uniref:F-box/SPRY domain-containing protein 1 n=1 Tax=Acyrthosiphon pisum TaxID=7029 RepID=A0A8R2H8W3_ACYPI|nr:F-box/SPRY domain-containing protein 1-like [Acyrthosiphon pisum]|eukprot:XP_016661254.1 PREDICTED: F-box/SPRY domain-containing protein 1-like [Acyrthosiphon pisum]